MIILLLPLHPFDMFQFHDGFVPTFVRHASDFVILLCKLLIDLVLTELEHYYTNILHLKWTGLGNEIALRKLNSLTSFNTPNVHSYKCDQWPLLRTRFTSAWIDNYIQHKVWDGFFLSIPKRHRYSRGSLEMDK